jgi:hypothetical protein
MLYKNNENDKKFPKLVNIFIPKIRGTKNINRKEGKILKIGRAHV